MLLSNINLDWETYLANDFVIIFSYNTQQIIDWSLKIKLQFYKWIIPTTDSSLITLKFVNDDTALYNKFCCKMYSYDNLEK